MRFLGLNPRDLGDDSHQLIHDGIAIISERLQLFTFVTGNVARFNSDTNLLWQPARSGPCLPAFGAFVQASIDHQDVREISDCSL